MRLAFHIVRKDFLRLRGLLALWGGVIVVQYVVWRLNGGGFGAYTGNAAAGKPMDLQRALWWLHLLAAWLLVAPLVQGDDLVSERAAWRTLPISGARLLAAKVLGLALMLCVWPSVLTGLWWSHLGFGRSEIFRVVAVNSLGMAVFVSPAFVVAALTDGFARFVAWSIVLVLAGSLGLLAFVTEIFPNGETGAVVVGVILATTMAVVALLVFLTRRVRLARGLFLSGIVGAAIGGAVNAPRAPSMPVSPGATLQIAGTTLFLPEHENAPSVLMEVGAKMSVADVSDREVIDWGTFAAEKSGTRDRAISASVISSELKNPEWLRATAAAAMDEGAHRGPRVSERIDSTFLLPRISTATFQLRADGKILRASSEGTAELKDGAGGGAGLRQLHVEHVEAWPRAGGADRRVSWIETKPLFGLEAALEWMRFGPEQGPDTLVAVVGLGAPISPNLGARWNTGQNTLLIGLVSAAGHTDFFHRNPLDEAARTDPRENDFSKARLAKVRFDEERRIFAVSDQKAFVPDLVVEGRLEDALKRARTENKPVMVRVYRRKDPLSLEPVGWRDPRVRAFLVSQFVCAEISDTQAEPSFKMREGDSVSMIVMLNADGSVRDRTRDFWSADELLFALRANLAGKTDVEALREELAARGGNDRQIRFQLVEALRVRGELAGVLDNMMWLLDHPKIPFERLEVTGVGQRLERLVAEFGPAREALLERRAGAVAELRRDPRNEDAARLVFEITLGLRHDDLVWREFPGLLPRENLSWWDFMANWIGLTVEEKRYREAVEAVDLEKFFGEGPAWVHTQLALRNQSNPAETGWWRQQLTWTGAHCVEALAGAGQPTRALRLAETVLRTDPISLTQEILVTVLRRAGATEQADQLAARKPSAP